jgi:Bacteriophage Lambda NinG protein
MTAKTHNCKVCKSQYTKSRPLQKVCSTPCALTLVDQKNIKNKANAQRQDRSETRAKLDAMRTKPQLVALAQKAFNAFIRARDVWKPCISCDKMLTSEPNSYDAGHYRSVGSAVHMRFVEDNVHGQCKHCNNHLAGNHIEYRKRLLFRIGNRAVELIESDQTLRKYTKEGLIEIARYYNAQVKILKTTCIN